jgi:virulence factor
MTEPRPLRVGLIGAGVIARLAQLPVLSADPTVTIAGVVTASPEESDEAVRRWPIERAYPDVDAMIADARLDALFVLTPKSAHRSFVEQGLAAGLDVFCEKPLASSLDDARAMVEAAERASGLLMVGLNRRYAELYVRARAEFAARRPDFVVGQKHRVGTEYRATLENGIHMLDLLRWFCGEAVEVTGAAQADDPYREDGAAALIRFDSGATALFAAARTAGEWDERLEAYGGGTTVRVVAPDELEISRGGERAQFHTRPRAAGWADLTETAGFAPAIRHFLHCARTREAPLTDAREAFRSQELMERVLAAAGLPTRDAD